MVAARGDRTTWRALFGAMMLVILLAAAPVRADVGYSHDVIPVAGGAPIPVAIWYPSTGTAHDEPLGLFRQSVAIDAPIKGRRLPLVVISHGNGGSKDGHYDTALALARAGFVVAALEHPGDNYHDQSRATIVTDRPAALSRLIDFVTTTWANHAAIDPRRIGAFGFSAGGFTVLAAAGGRPDFTLFGPHCVQHPTNYDCLLVKQRGGDVSGLSPVVRDRRIRALVVAAPALGFTFAHGLADVRMPVQLWRADADEILPAPEYADAVRAALPKPPMFEPVAGAGHFDFLAPCSPDLARAVPAICGSRPGFDRAAFHERFNRAVTAFFRARLGR